MTKRLQFAAEVMSTDAGLHADQAPRYIGKSCFNLATRPLLSQHDCTTFIKANNMERVLADIDADYGDRSAKILRNGVLLVFGAPCQLLSLARQEHGRTIPLTDFSPTHRSARPILRSPSENL